MFSDEYAVSAEDVKMGNAFSLPPSSLVAGAEWLSMCLYRHVVNAGQEWVLFRYGYDTKRNRFVWCRQGFPEASSFGNLEHADILSWLESLGLTQIDKMVLGCMKTVEATQLYIIYNIYGFHCHLLLLSAYTGVRTPNEPFFGENTVGTKGTDFLEVDFI